MNLRCTFAVLGLLALSVVLVEFGLIPLSIVGLALGVLVHALKQLVTARRVAGVKPGFVTYFRDNIPETLFSILCSMVFYYALPELVVYFPEVLNPLGFPSSRTFLSGFLAGFVGNSFADFLGGRINTLFGSGR